ncbi:DNA/RNA non-specific endonuclease [Gimesia fumaroli]|jgi:DNA/RNA endonuclease G (NUC1)|uniref:Nuclease n=1 Tax=Gimesia fumaroli TaxID=2527976 RepID=A0A518IAG1_9PLAN|nr:DNA/RNA non-specific endonuclease [Gimesia fumaroli]QDV50084.1 Nuclease precursor [Gimesia fumaroli]
MDYTSIHPSSINLAHLIDLHLWRGAPQNLDETRPIEILVNHGYVVGFSSDRLQPAWSAYRVAHADEDVDYDRPLSYYDDMRLSEEYRIGRKTFGRIGGIQLNVGHMTPNEVINRQFGRLAQLETFLMSNMSPQYASLNSGVWLKLETAIREIKDEQGKDHLWAIMGPVFGDNPPLINRGQGKHLPVPEHYFCLVVDPQIYPYDTLSKVAIDCFLIPQTAPRNSRPEDYPVTLEELEEITNLKFFASWARELPHEPLASTATVFPTESRLMKVLERKRSEELAMAKAEAVDTKADSIDELIEILKSEAEGIQAQRGTLIEEDLTRLRTIQHTISWLIRARDISPEEDERQGATLITYKITSDIGGKLEQGARTACNFWNRFVEPKQSIVIRLGIFTQNSNTIARAYKPYENNGIRYGRVEFNTKFLANYADDAIAGTIIHEIGHSLGIGFNKWSELFDRETGLFKSKAIRKLGTLEYMEVEREGGPGTAFSHWDELKFDKELMTGYKDHGEHVLPVTIDLMKILGHTVIERITEKTLLSDLLQDAASVMFSRQDEAKLLNLDYFEDTELLETIPHGR